MADGSEVIVQDGAQVPAKAQDYGDDLSFAQRMMTDNTIDMERVERVLQLELESEQRQAHKAFNKAMALAQAEMPNVVKNAANKQTHSRYAKLDAVDRAMKPTITKHGFSLSFFDQEPSGPDRVRVGCIIAHKDGHEREVSTEIQIDTLGPKGNAVKNKVHGWGSSTTYVRRKLKMMVFDVAETDDDDGNMGPLPSGRTIGEQDLETVTQLAADLGGDTVVLIEWLTTKGIQVGAIEAIPEEAAQMVIKQLQHWKKVRANG